MARVPQQATQLKTALTKVKALQDRAKGLDLQVKKLTKERDQQKADVTAARKEAADAAKRVQTLVEENRKLTDQFENSKEERKALVLAANTANRKANSAADRASAAEKEAANAKEEARKLREEVDQLKKQLGDTEGGSDVVSADRLGTLIDDLVARVENSASGLSLNSGKMTLQVGVADSKEGAAFVLPSATNPPEKTGPLHEVEINFDKSGRNSD